MTRAIHPDGNYRLRCCITSGNVFTKTAIRVVTPDTNIPICTITTVVLETIIGCHIQGMRLCRCL